MTTARARRRLLILGAGGFGREVLWTTSHIPADARDWDVAGFLDDAPDAATRLARYNARVPVLGTISDYAPSSDDVFVCALGRPAARLQVCAEITARGGEFATLIHPTALIHPDARVGAGLIVRHWAGISADCVIGDHVVLDRGAGTGHDAVVEDGCFLGAQREVMGGAHLERGVFLAGHAVVLPGVRVRTFATVGAGSVAIARVAAEQTVFGVPARRLDFGR